MPNLTCLALLLALAVGCSKEATPAPEQPDNAGAKSPAGAEGPAESAAGKPSYSEQTFALTLKPAGEVEQGKLASAEIVLEAKAPYHANDKYPYKLKLAESDGLSFPEQVVTKDKAKVEHMRVSMPVAFTAKVAGKHELKGTFQFSVCSEDKCLIEKRNLALEIEAK
jgi:hypothetical protein